MKNFFLLFCILSVFSSCVTKYHPVISAVPADLSKSETIFIENPELAFEYEILKHSGLYVFSSDPETPVHIRLKKAEWFSSLVELGFLLPVVTLGVIPVKRTTGYHYSFQIISDNKAIEKDYWLRGYYQTSLWEWLREDHIENEETYGSILRSQIMDEGYVGP